MIFVDLPLTATAMFFFVLSFAYAWGMLNVRIFRQDMRDTFAWDLAATVGIASVVSCTTVFVWIPRGQIVDILQVPYDLAIVFLAALPGMTYHRYKLNEYRDCKKNRSDNQLEMLQEQTREILKQQRDTKLMLSEVLTLIGMRQEAKEYLKQVINQN